MNRKNEIIQKREGNFVKEKSLEVKNIIEIL